MSKQTAVEWLIDMLVTEHEVILKGENYKLFEQAKQMEKEQIMDAHIEGQRVRDIILIHLFDEHPHTQWTNDQAEQYYNEVYSK